MNNKDLYSVRADDLEGQLRLAHLLQSNNAEIEKEGRVDAAIETWIARQYTNNAQFDNKCMHSKCPIERIPGTKNHYGCTKHLSVHECTDSHTIDQVERTKEGNVCAYTNKFLGQESIKIQTKQGIGTRSGTHFLSNAFEVIEAIVDDLLFNPQNRTVAYQEMYKVSMVESRNRVISYVESRSEEYECPDGHMPMADMLSMISAHSAPFTWTNVLETRSYDEQSDTPSEWIDLSRFRTWRNKIVAILSFLWTTMEEHGFNKSNVDRLREVCMYVLYIIKFNQMLSIANTAIVQTCPPLLMYLPREEILSSLPVYTHFKKPYDAQQFTEGKNLFTNFFANLVKTRPDIKKLLKEGIEERIN